MAKRLNSGSGYVYTDATHRGWSGRLTCGSTGPHVSGIEDKATSPAAYLHQRSPDLVGDGTVRLGRGRRVYWGRSHRWTAAGAHRRRASAAAGHWRWGRWRLRWPISTGLSPVSITGTRRSWGAHELGRTRAKARRLQRRPWR